MTSAEYDDELNKAMDALSTLISRKQRGDGRNYATAYDYMQVYLEVGFPHWLVNLAWWDKSREKPWFLLGNGT